MDVQDIFTVLNLRRCVFTGGALADRLQFSWAPIMRLWAKVISYKDIIEAQQKRDIKDAETVTVEEETRFLPHHVGACLLQPLPVGALGEVLRIPTLLKNAQMECFCWSPLDQLEPMYSVL